MTTYLLDFTATPLKPAAGGQYHRVHVGHGAHDNVQAAAADIILKYGMVGETADSVPEAKVVCYQENAAPFDIFVQVEPASAAPDYDPDPVKPTEAEVLAAFPLAEDIGLTGHGAPRRTFRLHQNRFIVWLDGDKCHVESMDKCGDLEFYRYHSPLRWVAAVRMLARLVLHNEREEIERLKAEAAALAAALGDAQ